MEKPVLYSLLIDDIIYKEIQREHSLPNKIYCFDRANREEIKKRVQHNTIEMVLVAKDTNVQCVENNIYELSNIPYKYVLFAYSYAIKQIIYQRNRG